MARFKCNNDKCKLYQEIVHRDQVRWRFDEKINKLNHEQKCEDCGSQLEYIEEETNGQINVYFASFGSQSPERKKEILKKRADEHNRTKMKDRTAEIKKRFINANKLKE